MRDEEYQSDQVAAYGASGQPAVAARMTPHLRMTQVGAGAAAASVLVAVGALVTFPRFTTATASGIGWGVLLLVCAVLMLGICVLQLAAWRQAMAWWRGERSTGPRLAPFSWWAHVVSYLVAVGALLAAMAGSAAAGWSATAATLMALSLLLLLAGQILGGVQYVRPEGPPGTVPAHMRRLLARERARQAAAAAIVERDTPHAGDAPRG